MSELNQQQPRPIGPAEIKAQIKNLEAAAKRIEDKKQQILFLTPDTKGNPRHSVITIYKHAKALRDAGYNASIFHEKKDYTSVGQWLGSSYDKIPHHVVEETNEKKRVKVSYSDFLIAPEVFGQFIQESSKLPVNKVVFIHDHEYMLEAYPPTKTWLDYGAMDTMVTNQGVADYIKDTLGIDNVRITPEFIGKQFGPSKKPKKPSIALYTRNPRKAMKVIKLFYAKYPMYRWFNFKHIAKINNNSLADQLRECMLSVWVDPETSWGSFALESIKTDIPVVGVVPNLIQDWISDENGMWTTDENQLIELIANYISAWLTGNIPEELQNVAGTIEGKYDEETALKEVVETYETLFNEKREVLLKAIEEGENQIKLMTESKIKTLEETPVEHE